LDFIGALRRKPFGKGEECVAFNRLHAS
jgi:hypothetical protein